MYEIPIGADIAIKHVTYWSDENASVILARVDNGAAASTRWRYVWPLGWPRFVLNIVDTTIITGVACFQFRNVLEVVHGFPP